MPHILRHLKINRVASVDRGAGENVQIVLMKRDSATKAQKAAQMTKDVEELLKKLTFEHKKDGTTRMWHESDPVEGDDGDIPVGQESGAGIKRPARKKSASSVLHKAIGLLKKSLESIFADAEAEQEELLAKTMKEFETHVQSAVAASDDGKAATEDAPGNGEGGGINKKESDMTEVEVTALKKALADKDAELAFLRLSPEEQAYAKGLPDDKKGAFCGKDEKARKEDMAARAKADAEQVPESVKKALVEADLLKGANEALAKRVAELEAKDETVALTKRAVEIGLGSADVEMLRKARKGDVEAVKALETKIGALTKQVKEAGLFRELGNGSTVGGSALDQITAKGEEFRKADSKLSQAQAFEKAYTDPANRELVIAYKRDKATTAS